MDAFAVALGQAAIAVPQVRGPLDALLLGNGDLNALLFARDGAIELTITKNDVWDARLITDNDPPLPTLELIEQAATNGQFPLGSNDLDPILPPGYVQQGPDSYQAHSYPCPRACAKVLLPLAGGEVPAGELDIATGRARLLAPAAGTTGAAPLLDAWALPQANVLLLRTPLKAQLQAVAGEDLPPAVVHGEGENAQLLQHIPGDADWPGMSFAVCLARHGQFLALAVVSSLEHHDPLARARQLLQEIAQHDPDRLLEQHRQSWTDFWSASGIALDDPPLSALWHRSLYFLRCISKPGVQCPGLFASLIDDKPAWHGDYHSNYNIQQVFWGCYAANHGELAEPYERLIHQYLPRAQWLSAQVYRLPGAFYPHVFYAYEPDPARCVSRNRRQYLHHTWAFTLGVTGFTVQPLWWAHRYAPDRRRLEETLYPPLREAACFYAAFVQRCPRGKDGAVRLGPSVSPEHWGWQPGFSRNFDCAFDLAMVRFTLQAASQAAGELGCDHQQAASWQAALALLPDYPRGQTADGREVVVDVVGAPPIVYNIPVPTTPIFPGEQVDLSHPPEERRQWQQTLTTLRTNGNNSAVMLALAYARLGLPQSQEWMAAQFAARLRDNGTLSLNRLLPPARFNDFGLYSEQFGAAMAVSELLLQSTGGVLRLFPALAPGRSAQFRQLRAEGGFLVSARSDAGRIHDVTIVSTCGGALTLANPWPQASHLLVGSARLPVGAGGLIRVANIPAGAELSIAPA